jgi:hypothetical protein
MRKQYPEIESKNLMLLPILNCEVLERFATNQISFELPIADFQLPIEFGSNKLAIGNWKSAIQTGIFTLTWLLTR